MPTKVDREIVAHLKNLEKDVLLHCCLDLLKALYFDTDNGWTLEKEWGSDQLEECQSAAGPLECEQFIPDTTNEEE